MLAVLLAAASEAPHTELARPSRGLFDAVTRRAFTAADYDADGFINKQEIYGLVLTAYVYANRAAPIEPPSRDTIEALLARLVTVNDAMAKEAAESPGGTATAMHMLQRHREIMHDFQQEFAKQRSQLREASERDQLL